jgi:signal transduction histidine kinase
MSSAPDKPVNWWEQHEEQILDLLPPVMLALSTAGAVGIDHGSHTKLLIDLAGSGGAMLTIALAMGLRAVWYTRPHLILSLVTMLTAITAVLVLNDPIYGFFAWTGYVWFNRIFKGVPRYTGVAATAAITGTSQHGGLPSGSIGSIVAWTAIVLVNFAIASGFSYAERTQAEDQDRREHMIDELTESNARLEGLLAENAGLHAQLLAQAREAGVQDERQRMAREIHDTLAQGLVGIIRQLEAADSTDELAAQRHIDAASVLARDSLSEARRSVNELAPAALEHAHLPDAIAQVAERWSRLSGIEASARTTGRAVPMRPEIEVALLRTTQEALANVARHAQAGEVVLTLSYMDDEVTLDIHDDGVGFNPESLVRPLAETGCPETSEGGFGLRAMRQRIEALSGTLQVESRLGDGTTIATAITSIRSTA